MYEIAYLLLSSLICGFRNIQMYAIRWNKENERMWAHKLIYTWKRIHVGPDLTSPHLLHPHTSRPFTVLTSSSIPKTRKGVNMLITTWTDHTLALGPPPLSGPTGIRRANFMPTSFIKWPFLLRQVRAFWSMTDTFTATIYISSEINFVVNIRVAEENRLWNLNPVIPIRMAIIIF